jgi:subtilisin family serine protease
VDDGARIISISLGEALSGALADALAWAMSKEVIIVAGLSNYQDHVDDLINAPATYSGVVSVAAIDANGDPMLDAAGTGLPVQYPKITVRAAGVNMLVTGLDSWNSTALTSGSSLATPIVAGELALVAQKWPEATSNQLLWSLISNTGTAEHQLNYSKDFGYGTANIWHMLRVDPSQYEDTNPLLDDVADFSGDITTEDVANASRPSYAGPDRELTSAVASPSGSASSGRPVTGTSAQAPVWLWIAIAGVVLAGAVVIVIVLAVHKRQAARAPAPPLEMPPRPGTLPPRPGMPPPAAGEPSHPPINR